MNISELVETFRSWLSEKTPDCIYCSTEFAKRKIYDILVQEAEGDTIFENDEIVVGAYDYDYELKAENSADGKEQHFYFRAFGIGSKENVTDNDYELADYTESSFILK